MNIQSCAGSYCRARWKEEKAEVGHWMGRGGSAAVSREICSNGEGQHGTDEVHKWRWQQDKCEWNTFL